MIMNIYPPPNIWKDPKKSLNLSPELYNAINDLTKQRWEGIKIFSIDLILADFVKEVFYTSKIDKMIASIKEPIKNHEDHIKFYAKKANEIFRSMLGE